MNNQQYFSESPDCQSRPQTFNLEFKGRTFAFATDSGVFSKGELDTGTLTLLSALPEDLSGNFLDLGCGWGAVGVMMGSLHQNLSITMSDINERAVALADQNCKVNGVQATVIQSDGFEQLKDSKFNCIALNPPIRSGKQNIYRLFAESLQHLYPDGKLYVVIRKQQGADSAQKYLSTLFKSVVVIKRNAGFRVIKCDGGSQDAV